MGLICNQSPSYLFQLLLERQAKIIDELERLQSVITSLTEEAPVRNIKKGTRMQTRTLLKPVNLPRVCNPSILLPDTLPCYLWTFKPDGSQCLVL